MEDRQLTLLERLADDRDHLEFHRLASLSSIPIPALAAT